MSDKPIEAIVLTTPVEHDESQINTPKNKSKVLLVLLPITLGFLGLLVGLAIGGAQYLTSQSGFESQTTIRILPAYLDPGTPHKERIQSMITIEQCLNRDGGKLRNLRSLDDLPSADIAPFISERLIVDSMTDDNSVFKLRLITPDKGDSPTLLNNLTYTYEQILVAEKKAQLGEDESQKLGSAMERLENAVEGKQTVRAPISAVVYKALAGLAIGLLIGGMFALIIK